MLNILILDEKYEKYEDSVSYSDYISEKDNVGIFLITSPGYISAKDKANCIECVEVEHPISNGMVEVVALELHRKYGIDRVYTNQEEFILRAANIRAMLGLKLGMRIQDALYFRDKLLMKQTCRAGGCPVPEFAQIYSPADILTFTEKFGFPCIIKPTLSCGSLGIRVLKDLGDCHDYLKNEFFAKRTDQELDCPGDWIIESFVNGVMYHVNGYARNGVLEYVWPFAYKNTNLLFTSGEEYGNVSIPTADARHAPLVAATEKILSALKCPDHLVFHCELFAYENKYLLCEIAARKPGGTICLLIDMLEGAQGRFPEAEFRLNNGLELRTQLLGKLDKAVQSSTCVGDLLIRRPIGKLLKLPNPKECPIKNLTCISLTSEESIYSGYNVNIINTSMRMIAISPGGSESVSNSLTQGHDWYKLNLKYTPAI